MLERAQVGYAAWNELTGLLHRRLGVQTIEFSDVAGENEPERPTEHTTTVALRFQPFSPAFGKAVEDLADVFGKVASECALWGPDVGRLSARPNRLDWGVE